MTHFWLCNGDNVSFGICYMFHAHWHYINVCAFEIPNYIILQIKSSYGVQWIPYYIILTALFICELFFFFDALQQNWNVYDFVHLSTSPGQVLLSTIHLSQKGRMLFRDTTGCSLFTVTHKKQIFYADIQKNSITLQSMGKNF